MDVALSVLEFDVVALGFVAVEDDVEGFVDAVGRVARVARVSVRGGMT